jgi:predicted XRE-type DNA-binding protein
MKTTNRVVTRGSGNVFADLGLPDAEGHMLKARIALYLSKRIKQLALTQREAAERMAISQPDVSNILRGKLGPFSIDRLLACVRALGSDVEITFKRPPQRREDRHAGTMRLVEMA